MSLIASARAFISGDSPTGREATIDVIRGLCIVSMVFAHVALGGIGSRITHAAVWYDGAMGFVLLSGLVVGLVHRKTVEREGLRAETVKAWKRARLVYVAHLSLCVLAFALAAAFPIDGSSYASVSEVGGWWQSVFATLTLQINPPKASILSLYVLLLLATPLAALLMRRRLWWVLAAAIAATFTLGHVFSDQLTLPRQPGVFGEINPATWQAMYFLAFIAGWQWRSVRSRLRSPILWAISAVTTAVIVSYARLSHPDGRPPFIDWAFGSGQMGPGTILLAFAVIVTMFPIVTWVDKRLPSVTGIISRLGRRSLDNYIILAFIVLPVQTIFPYERSSVLADLGAIATLLLMWVWSRLRDFRTAAKSSPDIHNAQLTELRPRR